MITKLGVKRSRRRIKKEARESKKGSHG